MQIKVHAVERIGPLNMGAGPNDYVYKVFGRGTDEDGSLIEVTCQSNKGEFEGMAEALLHHKPAVYTARRDNVIAIQRTQRAAEKTPPDEATMSAISKVRERSVRQS